VLSGSIVTEVRRKINPFLRQSEKTLVSVGTVLIDNFRFLGEEKVVTENRPH
jgi:hypothetical protein